MSFSGVELVFFLPVVLAAYWLLPRKAAWQNAFLIAASYVFYASWNPKLVPILLVATAVDYGAAIAIERNRRRPRLARLALGASLVYNLGQLAFFKYAGFFAESLNDLLGALGLGAPLPVLRVVLPLGISFYTFQKLSYVIDVYYERLEACRSPLRFAAFVSFFPQLVAGPIVRGQELLPQLAAPRAPSIDGLRAGAGIFLLGYVKKAYVADYLAQTIVDPVWSSPERYSTAAHWLALFGYAAQVFCDFSGYSEMAIGTGRLFGIELPKNFDFPFLAKNLMDFWRRWHITLNTWLFDYIYNPLTTGESWMRGRLELGFVIVFLVSGLWHGAKWTFLAWGLLHGLGLVAFHRWDVFYRGLCRKDRKWVAVRKGTPYAAAAWAVTQIFFVLTLVPFRAPSGAAALAFAKSLVVPQAGLLVPAKGPLLRGPNLLVCAAFLVGYHLLELARGRALRERFFALPAPVRGAVYGLAIAYLLLFVPVASGTFIYAQF